MDKFLLLFSIGLNIMQHIMIRKQRAFARAARSLVTRRY